MKKLLVMFLLLGLGAVANAATPTPTFTPSPTYTPTYTPTQVAIINVNVGHIFKSYADLKQNDGVTAALTSSAPGSASIYLAQQLSQTCAIFSTGTAIARFVVLIPNDYKSNLRLYGIMNPSTTGDTTTAFCTNVQVQRLNALTSTALTATYMGVTLNVQSGAFTGSDPLTLTTQASYLMQDSRYSLVYLPISATVLGPGPSGFKPGDTLNFQIVKAGGTTTATALLGVDLEYNYIFGRHP